MSETNQKTNLSGFARGPIPWVLLAALAGVVLPIAGAVVVLEADTRIPILLVSMLGLGGVFLALGIIAWRSSIFFASLRDGSGEQIYSQIVRGVVQSDGVLVLKPDALLLAPLVGKRIEVPYSEIRSVCETGKWFNGRLLLKSTGFWLDLRDGTQLGIAVRQDSADRLRGRIMSDFATL